MPTQPISRQMPVKWTISAIVQPHCEYMKS
jgi:hypothetical protein